ncbi:MAG TPA: selenocysteine-specific translation elongation factor [Candidatus Acidoferrales bacterium]|nr:selenocysteine-specific translation elongation factor [Candidatus Acidoferrales bacterium]
MTSPAAQSEAPSTASAPRRHVIVGTAGHIDHGKSSLVEALTGTHPDRLEEEKRRGITIDLGFAFLDCGGVRFGFVDVPGHERFVRNMLAGVGGIDLVLLVVAADESVMPQTREHFDICRLLGIPRGVVALTKSDLADTDMLSLARLETEELVRGSFLEGAPLVPVSARTGAGLDALRDALVRAAESCPARDAAGAFRLPIDRSFAIKGFGTVVTGTLVSGSLRAEDEAEILPGGLRVRVRGLQSGGKKIERALAGQRTAVNLAGVEHAAVARGMTLVPPGRFSPTARFQARIELLPTARGMRRRFRAHLFQGSAETVAVVRVLDPGGEEKAIGPGESRFAELRTAAPVFVLPGDRFVLRQYSPVITMGGGVVLDTLPSRRRRDAPALRRRLDLLEHGDRPAVVETLLADAPRGLAFDQVLRRTGWDKPELQAAAEALVRGGKARLLPGGSGEAGMIAAAQPYAALVERLRAEVEAYHGANPLAEGISKEELRIRVARVAGPAMFRAALTELVAGGQIALAGDTVKRAGREIFLAPEEARAKEQIEQAFAQAGLTVPSLKEVLEKLPVEAARTQKIVQILLREQVLVRVAQDLVFHRTALERVRQLLAGYKKQHGDRMSVPAFKELTGITRKYAIPLLEHLDRERVTRRVGDERVIL